MNKKEMDSKIYDAFAKITPDIFDEVKTSIEKNDVKTEIIYIESAKPKHTIRKFVAVAAVFALIAAVAVPGVDFLRPVTSVALDVNPSIEMKINSKEHIVSCNAANEDAVKIIDGMDLRGTDIDVAVNALIGSMVKNGYLSADKNSVLVTVSGGKNEATIKEKISLEIAELLNASIGESAVLSQTLSVNEELETASSEYSISPGKAALIYEIIKNDSTLKFEELAPLSVNDLTLLSSTRHSEDSNISVEGTASSKGYIGLDKAKETAASMYPGGIIKEAEFDCDDGRMVYEIEIVADGAEHDIELDAVSGKCLSDESEKVDKKLLPTKDGSSASQDRIEENHIDDEDDDESDYDDDDDDDFLDRLF